MRRIKTFVANSHARSRFVVLDAAAAALVYPSLPLTLLFTLFTFSHITQLAINHTALYTASLTDSTASI